MGLAICKAFFIGFREMSRTQEKISYKGKFGRITGTQNDESEFKVGLFFSDEIAGVRQDRPKGSEVRILEVGEEIWLEYLKHRYAFEEKQDASADRLDLADGDQKPSFHQEQDKERRLRSFFIMAHGHPYDLEIRVEHRDGEKITMLKKGNGANPANPIIRRQEFKLVSDIRESTEDVLRGLPKKLQTALGFEFGKNNRLYEPLQSNSMRLKTKVRLIRDTEFGLMNFVIEPAFDEGSGLIATADRWAIREFEGEVKGVYKIGSERDIKANPESAGITHEEMGRVCAEVLKPEREDYMEFAQLYLLQKARDDAAKYGDIEVAGVYDSKSTPGRRILNDRLKKGLTLDQLMRCPKTGRIKSLDWTETPKFPEKSLISLEKTFQLA